MLYDIIIIGAGTAGMTAALYAKRAGKSVMLLEAENFGGQISYTPRIENYPGIKQISGSEFSSALFDQITALSADFDLARVDKIANTGKYKIVFAEGKEYRCKAIIIAVGVKPRLLNIPREEELSGEGVCYCAVCDGAFYIDRQVAVVGGGNSALTDALFLSSYCTKVYLIVRESDFLAEKMLQDRVNARNNIEVIFESCISRLLGEKCLDAIEISSLKDGGSRKLDVAAIFVAIGRIPDNNAFAEIIKLDKAGFILAENCRTTADGIFAAGDCRAKELRQLTTAVSDGAVAAIAACEFCDSLEV